MRTRNILVIPLAALALAGCGMSDSGRIPDDHVLLRPQDPEFQATAPAAYRVRFETTAGDFDIQVNREWAPNGADRFYNLVRHGYYDGVRFFRVIEGFMAQFGIHGDPRLSAVWSQQLIPDDLVQQSNRRGTVTFATSGPNSRTVQLFINFVDNAQLDNMGFAPIGEIVAGMDVVDALYSGYGEGAPGGQGPIQPQIQAQGNEYLDREFSRLDSVVRATILD